MSVEPIRTLVEAIAKALVDHPEEVTLEAIENDGGTVLELRVDPEDLGKVIGKQGRTARSIRTLVASAAARRDRSIAFEILE